MKKRSVLLIVAALLLAMCFVLTACSDPEAENYEVADGVITAYIGPGGDVTVPAKIGGKKITAIGEAAFKDNLDITGVAISDGIKEIGTEAFSGCNNMTKLTLGTVERVGEQAFFACWSLVDLTIPDTLTEFAPESFSLITLNIESEGNGTLYIPATVKSLPATAFQGAQFNVVQFESATLPVFEDGTFSNTGKVKIILPDSVTPEEIEDYRAVLGAAGFTTVQDFISFYNESGEELVMVYTDYSALFRYNDVDGVIFEYIGDDPDVVVPSSINGYPVTTIYEYAFMGNEVMENVTISEGITQIKSAAFSDCPNLKTVIIGEGAETIGDSGFSKCPSLVSVSMPNTVTTLGDASFYGCSSLKEINLSTGITAIGINTFRDCACLERIVLPEGLTALGDFAFDGCTALSSINLSSLNHLTTMGIYCFSGTAITEVTVPGTVEIIPEACFLECPYLVDITVEEGVKRIGINAFTSCGIDPAKRAGTIATTKIKPGDRSYEETGDDLLPFINIHLPKSLEYIDMYMVAGCWVNAIDFMTVETMEDLPEFDVNAFFGAKFVGWIYFTEEAIEAHGTEFDEYLMTLNNMSDRAWYYEDRDLYWASENPLK